MATPERLARLRQITATGAQPEPDQEHDRLERLRQLTGQQAEPPRRSPFARHEGTLRERVGAGLREAADVALQFTGRAGQGVTAAASGVAKLASTRLGRAMLPTPEGVPERVAESLDERYRTIGEVVGEPQSVGGAVSGVGGRVGVETGLFMLPGTQAQKLAVVRQLPRFRRLATTLGLDALVDAAIGAGSDEGSTAAAAAEFFPEYEWLQQVAADPAKRAAFEAATGLSITTAVAGIARGAVEIADQVRRARAALDLTPDIERATQQAFSEYGRAQARAQRQRFPTMQPPPPPPRQPEPGTAADVALRRAQALAEQRRIDEGLARQAEEEAARRRAMELEGAEPSDPRLVRGAAPPREPGLIEPPPRGEEPLIVPGTALRPREPLIRPPEPGELASVAETGMTTRRPRTPDVAAELAASLRRPGRARISDAAEAAEEAAAEAATATATARPMTIEEAQSRYGRALLQQLIEDAEIAGAGSPVRRKIANEDPNLAIGGVGTGAGAFARGRRTQAARRASEAEQVLESWGGVAPDPDLAILRAIDDDPLAVPHQVAVEHSALRNLDDDAVLRRLDEAEELAYRNQDSPSAMVRRAMLAGEAKRRGLIEARPGFADPRVMGAVARTGAGAVAGAALDEEDPARGALAGGSLALGGPPLIRGAVRGRAQRGAFQHFPITERGQQVRARIRRGGDVHRPGMRYPRGEPEGVDDAIAARRAEREAAEEASRDRIIERATERTEASQAELRERWARDPWGMRADEEQFIREQQRQRERRFMEARFGGVDPKVLSVLARTGTGAAAGAAVDDENRVRGAVIGAAIANAPSVARSARRGRRSANVPAYLDNPDVQAVLGTVSSRRQPSLLERVRALPERTRRASRDAYRRLVDETQPLRDFGRIVGKSPRLSHLVSQAKGWRGGAQLRIGTELRDVMQLAKGHEKGVVALAKAERALELARAGMAEKGVDLQAAERTVRELSRVPEVRRAVDALRGYYRRLLEFKLDNGVLTPEQFERITANGEHYVPFVRDFGVDPLPPSAGGGRFTNRGTGVRRMTEGRASAPTVDPFEQAVLDTFEAHRTVAKQRVTNAVAELVEADPDAASEFLRRLDGDEKARTGREVAAMVNGQRQRYEVLDEQLYEAWAAFDRRTMNLLVRVMAPFKRALQAGVTLMPDFAARNTMRDNVQSAIQYRAPVRSMAAGAATGAAAGALSDEENRIERALIGAGLGLGIGGIGPQLVRSAAALSDILGDRDVYREWLREGGSGFSEFYGRPEDARRLVRQLMGDRSLRRTILLPVDGARSLGRILEEAPRLARYKAMRKAGADIPEAIAASRDVSLDFANIGADMKPVAAVTAFFNAKVQGWDKLVRMLRHPRTWALGASMISAPSIALWAINKDDPEYWARPQWERNLFWLVPNPGGGFFRIPKPFEVGFLFASLPERILDYAYQKDPEVLTFALKDMLTSTTEGTVPIPTALQPLLENVVNYDFFTNRPVVSPGLERLDPAFQHDNRTSSVAVLLGRQLDISPQKIDNVLRDWSGNFGRDALRAADALARATGVDERPAQPARGAPILSSFVTQEGASSDFEHTIRRRFERAERARNTARDLAKRGDEEQLRRYIQKNAEQLLAYEALKAQNDMLRKVSEMRREIANAQGVDAETKREAIARLNRGVATLLMQIGRGEVLAQPAN